MADSGGKEIKRKGEEGNPAYVLAMDKGDAKDGKEVAKKGDKLHSREGGDAGASGKGEEKEEEKGDGAEDEAAGKGAEDEAAGKGDSKGDDAEDKSEEAKDDKEAEGEGKQDVEVDVGEKRAPAEDGADDKGEAKKAKTSPAKGAQSLRALPRVLSRVVRVPLTARTSLLAKRQRGAGPLTALRCAGPAANTRARS